jgi:hypothetical protein
MSRKSRVPIRLDIVGLNAATFQDCMLRNEALVASRQKGAVSRTGEVASEQSQISDPQFELCKKIAAIALDFQKAYGRAVEIRVFERSSNRLFDRLLKVKSAKAERVPEFYVNGVIIFKGVPNSFSELDEAIERAYGRS